MENNEFAQLLLAWYDQNARDLPWRHQRDPYAIWLSEVMLQQTQVNTVIPYYNRFLNRFPTLDALSAANDDEVLKFWEGLGYYRRARLFLQGVREVVAVYDGRLPENYDRLSTLPGVGAYMAGALSSIAYNHPAPAVDGNVIRVVTRVIACKADSTAPKTRRLIEQWVMNHISSERAGDFNQAMMELGATLCKVKSPQCDICPVQAHCLASKADPEEFPVKKSAKRITVEQRAVYVVRDDQHCCMMQRDQSLLYGLWEYPNRLIEAGSEEDHTWATQLFGCPISFTFRGEAVETFTHLKWEMSVYEGIWPPEWKRPTREGLGWFLPAQVKELAKAGFVKKVDRVIGKSKSPPHDEES